MKNLLLIIAVLTLALPSASVWSATLTVTLAVPSMTCATCPITVKKALSKVVGVGSVKVSWEPKEAVVTFNDAKTNVTTLILATTNAGYPSQLKNPQP